MLVGIGGLMNFRAISAVLLFSLAVAASSAQRLPPPPPADKAQKTEKAKVHDLVLRAQFVVVMAQREAEMGQQRDAIEYRAIADVEAAVSRWGRYKVVMNRADADLIFSVRRAEAVPFSGRPRIESGSSGDYLAVFDARGPAGSPGSPYWRATQKDGLARGRMSLLKALQDDIEATASARKTP